MRRRITALLLSAVMIFSCFVCLGASPATNGTEENDSFYTSKSTVYNGDGTYTITMEGYAKGEVITTTTETALPADIVLVLDTSGSMSDDIPCATTMLSKTDSFSYKDIDETTYYYKWTDGEYYEIHGVANRYSWLADYRTWAYFEVGSSRYYLYGSEVILADPNHKDATWNGDEGDYPLREDNGARIECKQEKGTDIFSATVYYKSSGEITKLNALKQSVNSFLDAIYADAVENNVDHKVAIVTFASSANNKANLTSITTGLATLKSVVNNLSANGATRADLGMQSAYDILAADTRSDISKTAVMFTDGGPTDGYVYADFSDDSEAKGCASAAISASLAIKSDAGRSVTRYGYDYYVDGDSSDKKTVTGLGGTVYTIGCFSEETVSIRTYMNGVSSNYPNAQNYNSLGSGSDAGYYMNATDSGQLSSVFSTIASSVSEGSSKVTLDTTAVLTDIITDDFKIPNGAESVKVYTAPCTGESNGELTFGDKTVYTDAVKTVVGNKVTVTNFDYAANWCGKQADGNYGGKKLIVEVTVKPVNDGTTDLKVPSNEEGSGIGEEGSDPSFEFDKPTVDTYNCTVEYYKDGVLFKSETSTGRYLPGATVTADAIVIPGYTVDADSKSMTVGKDAGSNTIRFDYTVNNYTVTYDYNDGTTPDETVNYTVNDTVTVPSAPTREHYKFNGWLIESTDGNWPAKDYTYNGGESLKEMYGNVVLKAKWTAMYGYALNFNANSGTDTSVSGMPANQPETWTETGTKTYNWTEVPSRTGYTFLGWAESADGNVSAAITDNKTVSVTGTGAEVVTKTLYAKWDANDYTITYNANGGTLTGAETQSYTVEDRITLTTAPTRAGYTFTGWKLETADGNWTAGSYKAMQEINPGMYGDVTLTAQWQANKYTISYDANGGTLTGAETQSYTVADGITLASAPTRDGYTFAGWELKDADGNWTAGDYSAEQAIAAGKYGDVTLRAKWTENTATVNYMAVGPEGCGSVSPASETLNVVSGTASGSTATAANGNYKFVGWYSDEACTKLVSSEAKFVPAKDAGASWKDGTTYYAKFDWNVADLTITKSGCDMDKDANQSFIFHITGNGTDMYVTVQGNGSVTVKGLQVGTYTVTEDTNWSWRYTPTENNQQITIAVGKANTVTFENERTNDDWIGDGSYAINRCVKSLISNAIDKLFGN